MIDLGLRQAEMEDLQQLLVTHHAIGVTVQLLNMEHGVVGDLSDKVLGGQVTIDATAEGATRSASLEVLDPLYKLHLDPDSPEDGSLYFHRMIRVIYHIMPPDRNRRYDIPVFTGPLTKVERNGYIITIEAMGKEKLSSQSVWTGKTYKKGLKKTWVIRDILSDLGGETRLDIPDLGEKTPGVITMNREKTPWGTARGIAASMGMQLFYDGRGVARLRRVPKNVVYTFKEKGALLSMPQAGYDAEGAINAVYVIGGKPKGSKKKISYRLVAPAGHPLSPNRLGRWGKPRYLPETIENGNIKSLEKAKKLAQDRLKSALIESVEVAFDALPIMFLEEMDLCRVSAGDFSGTFRLEKMTIPLTASGTSSVGYLRKTQLTSYQIQIKKAKSKKKKQKG